LNGYTLVSISNWKLLALLSLAGMALLQNLLSAPNAQRLFRPVPVVVSLPGNYAIRLAPFFLEYYFSGLVTVTFLGRCRAGVPGCDGCNAW